MKRLNPQIRLAALFADDWTLGDLVRFHAAHKLTLLSHHVRERDLAYLPGQAYLDLHPAELDIRGVV